MKKSTRLDAFLAERALSESREKAKKEILSGWVKVDGETVREPSRRVSGDEDIVIARPGGVFASRGGDKLEHALNHFGIDVKGLAAADLGASTGGFTDCLLKRGAALVYAVDVGYGQLDYRLRQDPRVVAMDRTNVRSLTRGDFPRSPDFITADLSFISLIKIAGALIEVFSPVEGVLLVKPQFEALKSEQKKGVVRKPDVHKAILRRVITGLSEAGLEITGLCRSPVKGPAGNIEFFLRFKAPAGENASEIPGPAIGTVDAVVDEAHRVFKNHPPS